MVAARRQLRRMVGGGDPRASPQKREFKPSEVDTRVVAKHRMHHHCALFRVVLPGLPAMLQWNTVRKLGGLGATQVCQDVFVEGTVRGSQRHSAKGSLRNPVLTPPCLQSRTVRSTSADVTLCCHANSAKRPTTVTTSAVS